MRAGVAHVQLQLADNRWVPAAAHRLHERRRRYARPLTHFSCAGQRSCVAAHRKGGLQDPTALTLQASPQRVVLVQVRGSLTNDAVSQLVLEVIADSGIPAQAKGLIAELRLQSGSHDASSQLWRALGALATADLITLEARLRLACQYDLIAPACCLFKQWFVLQCRLCRLVR